MSSIRKLSAPLIILSILIVSGCSLLINSNKGPDQGVPFITDPETVRWFTLTYLNKKYGLMLPPEESEWIELDLFQEEQRNSTTIAYKNSDLQFILTYPQVEDESLVYNIIAEEESSGFTWNGVVDAYGHISEISITTPMSAPTTIPIAQSTLIPNLTATPTPVPTLLPTDIPLPTFQPVTLTQDQGPCNKVVFMADVTIPDGTTFAPGTPFTKTWRLQNTGFCTWTTNYDLVYISGDRLGGSREVELPDKVEPGKSVDVSVGLVSPGVNGAFKGYWKLRSQVGEVFGLGTASNQSFTVVINVISADEDYRYDFAVNFCDAVWRSETGRLSCSSTETNNDGLVRLLVNPSLEDHDVSGVVLNTHPNEAVFGWISGTYPYITIEEDDQLVTSVGCLSGYGHCRVSFYIDYEGQDGFIHHLGRWDEIYDGEITRIKIDLSSLEGQTVQFILGMEGDTREVQDAQGFWLDPRIEQP